MINRNRFPCKCLGKSQYKYYHNSSYKTLGKCLDMSPNNHRNQLYILLCKN